MAYRQRNRRGILLLVVLSLLVLFMLIGVTFIVVAGQYQKATVHAAAHERTGDDYYHLTDGAIYQLIRGPQNNFSSLLGHDLLGDHYGNDGFKAEVVQDSVTGTYSLTLANGQFTRIKTYVTLGDLDNWGLYHFNGCTLTFISGGLKSTTCRIVNYERLPPEADAYGNTRQVAQIDFETIDSITTPNVGDRIIVNGRPFSGTGAGRTFDAATLHSVTVDDVDPVYGWPKALQPHYRAQGLTPSILDVETLGIGWGGRDEDYDAADFQNMHLGLLFYEPNSNVPTIVPSFHRPALLNYWAGLVDDGTLPAGQIDEILRRTLLRPNWIDNPYFTGSNPALTPGQPNEVLLHRLITGVADINADGTPDSFTADVDNDGDGWNDSYWLDLGFPEQVSSDGRRYRPLFAILCLDNDSRVNVNTATTLAGVREPSYPNFSVNGDAVTPDLLTPLVAGGGTVNFFALPRGEGYGAAEIELSRYASSLAIVDPTTAVSILDRRFSDGGAGIATYDDQQLFAFKRPNFGPQLPPNYTRATAGYTQAPDVLGRSSVVLDNYGQPMYLGALDDTATRSIDLPEFAVAESTDDPYEMNLITENSGDARFTEAALESIQRVNDFDNIRSTQPVFLNGQPSELQRSVLTTRSFSVPSLPGIPRNLRENGVTSMTIIDLFDARLDGTVLPPLSPEREAHLRAMVAWEFFRGERIDLNRPFGNGLDDDGDQIVDEWGDEWQTGLNTTTPPAVVVTIPSSNVLDPRSYWNDDPVAWDNVPAIPQWSRAGEVMPYAARQIMARHLYCLMMFLTPDADLAADTNNVKKRQYAQWAINIVDYRDADSIMTPFEFDLNPFNGWGVNGDILNNTSENPAERGVVWGCERPELLITETFAFHDRRTEDTDADSDGKIGDTAPNLDDDRDQRLKPRTGFFVEIYNPGQNGAARPAETNGLANNGTVGIGVQLDKKVPGTDSLVWRIVVGNDKTKEPETPEDVSAPYSDSDLDNDFFDRSHIERSIYFSELPLPSSYPDDISGVEFYPLTGVEFGPIVPNGFAVIGSAETVTGGRFETIVDKTTDDTGTLTDRTILLEQDGNYPVQIPLDKITPSRRTLQFASTVVVPIQGATQGTNPRSLSLTDPPNGYPAPTGPPTPDGPTYNPVMDTPLDADRFGDPEWVALKTHGTTVQFRTIFLQRLANPDQPWHPTANPYLTVDRMGVDLANINSAEPTGSQDEPQFTKAGLQWSTFERGSDINAGPGTNMHRMLWPYEPTTRMLSPTALILDDTKDQTLWHTLGYWNWNYRHKDTARVDEMKTLDPGTGEEINPFPWFTWNNRPYSNRLEVLQVPAWQCNDVLRNFTTYDSAGGRIGYGHLIAAATKSTDDDSFYFGAFLDFVTVRSPYMGTEKWFNFDSTTVDAEQFRPPFNYLSRFREPGKVNINTLMSADVWEALNGGYPAWGGTKFTEFWRERQQTGSELARIPWTPPIPGQFHVGSASNLPTFFSRVYRSGGNSDLAPSLGVSNEPLQRTNDMDGTIMRVDEAGNHHLWSGAVSNHAYDNPLRNPYFQYLGMRRLDNLVTTQSNVYSVWVTVGYFEVGADGTLGQELGWDTGDIKRHRAYYLIDRSIPVAYEPGVNHNVDKCILVRRYIE